jgi:hypothetical protein
MIDCTGFVDSIKVVGRNRASLSEEARYVCQLCGVAMSGINCKKS